MTDSRYWAGEFPGVLSTGWGAWWPMRDIAVRLWGRGT